MKHILFFFVQSLIVLFYFVPIVVGRFIWTFKWNDRFEGIHGSIFKRYKKCYLEMILRIKGHRIPSTF